MSTFPPDSYPLHRSYDSRDGTDAGAGLCCKERLCHCQINSEEGDHAMMLFMRSLNARLAG